jgi:hypothetical protein
VSATFAVSDEINQLIREHLVSPAQIALMTGVSRAAVGNWLNRYPQLARLTVTNVYGPLFWWPQFEAALAELGLPDRKASEVQRRRAEWWAS